MTEKNKLGVALFLFGEANFFLVLILAYIYYHVQTQSGPTAANSLDVLTTAIFSLFLFSSSFTIWRANRNLSQGNWSRWTLWLFLTIAFGAVFLVGQGTEYARLFSQNVTISRDLFGTTFFTLTGVHGLHVLIGLILLTILLGFTLAGQLRGPYSPAAESISLYWHFVDAVWVLIFSIVYLWALV